MTQATVIVADDDAAIRTVVRQALIRKGHLVRTTDTLSGLNRLLESGVGDVVVTDVGLPDGDGLDFVPELQARRPGLPVIVVSAQNTLATAVRATERGAFEYLPKPFDLDELGRAVAAALDRDEAGAEPDHEPGDDLPLIGRSPAMQDVYRLIARVVPTDLTVLILGESGTGKELVARAVHDLGPRRTGPFVAVNMAAIPRELIETELFGHEKGAFTGAQARSTGRFEQAQGGTLFLDEIGDMPMDTQTRLLRVLQSGEFQPVGGARTIRTDVRIICATHQDLRRSIEAGTFREDLFYRLNVVPIAMPPLRDRRADIGELARHFLKLAAEEGLPKKSISSAAITRLEQHDWPGNVRELQNLIRRMAALAREDLLDEDAVIEALGRTTRTERQPAATDADLAGLAEQRAFEILSQIDETDEQGLYEHVLAEVEPSILRAALSHTQGNQIRAAKLLGMNRNTLRARLESRNIDALDFRARD
ncbi:nitrogen regulation protein NR(I) [Pacificimonas flava]|uniref:DNA-binding transcriptional regulator NtrC n=2 Tax=Pacificimonas TaxID=1960290 RepID=A0A219B714_9SPHN|nr:MULTISPECIES: nitrogen regulation protein NR(I) [Pacificimonas]MBZ6378807.1 nitrogen regulation protein NR(I) [Pacificimonas aurantium]OWV33933.1 nitrogen regulation protein NR(I) [Pacificimonas flava]